jgi:hypothetical protein
VTVAVCFKGVPFELVEVPVTVTAYDFEAPTE